MEKKQGIGFFEKYLTIWVALCIVIGIAVGQWLPVIPQTLSKLEYANVSIPVAILIWLMIYPMMLKVDFQSVKNVGKRPRGIIAIVTLPEATPVFEAERLQKDLQRAGINNKWWAVNACLSLTDTENSFLRAKAQNELTWIKKVEELSKGNAALIAWKNN